MGNIVKARNEVEVPVPLQELFELLGYMNLGETREKFERFSNLSPPEVTQRVMALNKFFIDLEKVGFKPARINQHILEQGRRFLHLGGFKERP